MIFEGELVVWMDSLIEGRLVVVSILDDPACCMLVVVSMLFGVV